MHVDAELSKERRCNDNLENNGTQTAASQALLSISSKDVTNAFPSSRHCDLDKNHKERYPEQDFVLV